jgi:metallophosphoesterase superfamily enzyme
MWFLIGQPHLLPERTAGGLRQNLAEPGSATWLAEGFGIAVNTVLATGDFRITHNLLGTHLAAESLHCVAHAHPAMSASTIFIVTFAIWLEKPAFQAAGES